MNYKSACVLLTLLTITTTYSDITMLNCPAQFDIAAYNVSSDTTVATMGSFVYAGFTSQSNQDKVQEIVAKGDFDALNAYIFKLAIPYIIFAVIFFAFYIFTVLCCLFDRSCPPCDSIRRDIDNNPYSTREMRVMMVLLLLCAGGTLFITIISFSFVPELKQNLSMTSCSIYLTFDTAMNGDDNWGGFTNLRDKVGNITNLLSAAVTQIQIYFPGDSWLITSMQSMQIDNVNLYSKYRDSQMITPNPISTAVNLNANISVPMIDSLFIKKGLGPNSTAGTMITDIDSGLRTTAKLSEQAFAITQAASFIQTSVYSILNNSLASQNMLLMYNRHLNVSLTEFQTFSQKYFNQNFAFALTIFQAVFGLALTGSLIIIMGLVATHCFQVLNCRKMVHLGWTIYGLSYIGVVVVTFFALSVGSISYNFCTYFNQMLTVQVAYNKLGQAYTQNLFTRMDTCLFGDGNSLSKFSIAQQMGTVTSLFTNIQTYFDYTNNKSSNYVNTSTSTDTISKWITTINNYKVGVKEDCSDVITSDDNPKYALKTLNLYTYQGGGVPTGSKDVWVWDKINCTDPTQQIYTAGPSLGTTLSTTNVTCISFNQKIRNNATQSWTYNDFISRYVQIKNTYSNAYNFIGQYGETLISFRDSRINLFQSIYDDLNYLLGNNSNFNAQLTNFKGRVKQFYDAVSTLNNLITNSLTGLTVSSNCKPLADKMRFIYNVYCVNFQAQVTKIAVCSLAMLLLMLLGVIAGSKFGIMYAEVQKMKRVSMPEDKNSENPNTQLQMETSQYTEKSEDSED